MRTGRLMVTTLTLLVLFLTFAHHLQARVWSNQSLRTYLHQVNREACLLVTHIEASQNGHALMFYDQTGREEKRAQLQERPILKPASPAGPFVVRSTYVLLVDKSQVLTLHLGLDKIILAADSRLSRQPLSQMVLMITPAEKEERLLQAEGQEFKLTLDDLRFCKRIILEAREPQERHQLVFKLMDKNKSFTLEKE